MNKKKTLNVVLKAEDLAAFTLKTASNEKNFPKRYRFTITNKIVDKAFEIYTLIYEANELFPHNATELEVRQNKQRMAIAYCRSMQSMIDIAYNAFPISSKTVEIWTGKIFDVRNLTVAWLNRDRSRFAGKF
ncbi:MAG: four helix bundle protein [Lachnospiraceae bacterium]|nr:four helix bundle protein [Lachnospiraceae bacterium]